MLTPRLAPLALPILVALFTVPNASARFRPGEQTKSYKPGSEAANYEKPKGPGYSQSGASARYSDTKGNSASSKPCGSCLPKKPWPPKKPKKPSKGRSPTSNTETSATATTAAPFYDTPGAANASPFDSSLAAGIDPRFGEIYTAIQGSRLDPGLNTEASAPLSPAGSEVFASELDAAEKAPDANLLSEDRTFSSLLEAGAPATSPSDEVAANLEEMLED